MVIVTYDLLYNLNQLREVKNLLDEVLSNFDNVGVYINRNYRNGIIRKFSEEGVAIIYGDNTASFIIDAERSITVRKAVDKIAVFAYGEFTREEVKRQLCFFSELLNKL